jgi:Putative peptidoglycan binding domain
MGTTSRSRARIDDEDAGLASKVFRSLLGERPADRIACLLVAVTAVAIVFNALYRQRGVHPAPMLGSRAHAAPASVETTGSLLIMPRPRPAELLSPTPSGEPSPQVPRLHPAPIKPASLPARDAKIAPPSRPEVAPTPPKPARIVAVQRALTDFGYGQLRVTGVLDEPTKAAVEKFERERRLPTSGQITDRLMRELAAVTGRSLE